jgi:hypothetical protein
MSIGSVPRVATALPRVSGTWRSRAVRDVRSGRSRYEAQRAARKTPLKPEGSLGGFCPGFRRRTARRQFEPTLAFGCGPTRARGAMPMKCL